MSYQKKYFKYKTKYLNLQNALYGSGGVVARPSNIKNIKNFKIENNNLVFDINLEHSHQGQGLTNMPILLVQIGNQNTNTFYTKQFELTAVEVNITIPIDDIRPNYSNINNLYCRTHATNRNGQVFGKEFKLDIPVEIKNKIK